MTIKTSLLAAALAACTLLPSTDALAEPVGRDDRVVILEGSGPVSIPVLGNDAWTLAELTAGQISIVAAPGKGTASLQSSGRPGAADDRVLYTPSADALVEDHFVYRVCTGATPVCADATVRIVLRPYADIQVDAPAVGGFLDLQFSGLQAMPSPRFDTLRLVEPVVGQYPMDPDPTPTSPWDSPQTTFPTWVTLYPYTPAPQAPRPRWILVDARSMESRNFDLYVGVDRNGNGVAEASEIECVAAMTGNVQRCEIQVSVQDERMDVWALSHNRDAATNTVKTEIFAMAAYDDASLSYNYGLSATGPGVTAQAENFPVRLSWYTPWIRPGQALAGYLMVRSAPGQPARPVPVRIDRTAGETRPVNLLGPWFEEVFLPAGASLDGLFFDVPVGADSVMLATGARNIDVYLSKVEDDTSPRPSRIPTMAEDALVVRPEFEAWIPTSTLTPGRWYAKAVNAGATPAYAFLSLDFEGAAVKIRPGSYFNPARSGHGLFLYPAGSTWAGLWYTYLQDGSSTWYYLQRSALTTHEGAFRLNLYRAAWDGSANHLARVGEATVTATSAQGLVFTYQLDGELGSEPMVALGEGCPSLDGQLLDTSSHWFNPARAGTGYSVQMFPDYEFYAAFVYDSRGVARFLTSEAGSFRGADATLPLEQLTGFCPLCARTGAPTRADVGTLRRRFDANGLVQMELDALFTGGVPGAWTGNDLVQALGGPGTTQGCPAP